MQQLTRPHLAERLKRVLYKHPAIRALAGRPRPRAVPQQQPIPASSSPTEHLLAARLDLLESIMFQDLTSHTDRVNTQLFDRVYKGNGPLRSPTHLDEAAKIRTEVFFHHRDKAEVALTVCSSWYGGDYFEFGAQDLNTFRNMLSAYNICGMSRTKEDVRFYAFDVFGDPSVNAGKDYRPDPNFAACYSHYLEGGNQMKIHQNYLKEHNIYQDKCHLVQGLFQYTLTPEFKAKYKAEGRSIGYAFLDVNMTPSYITVFDYIFDMMAPESYIYMDEYFQNPSVIEYYGRFCERLRKERNMGSVYIRNAGGFGGLFRLYPLGVTGDEYDIR